MRRLATAITLLALAASATAQQELRPEDWDRFSAMDDDGRVEFLRERVVAWRRTLERAGEVLPLDPAGATDRIRRLAAAETERAASALSSLDAGEALRLGERLAARAGDDLREAILDLPIPLLAERREAAREALATAELHALRVAADAFEIDQGRRVPTGPGAGALPEGVEATETTALTIFLDGDPANGGPATAYFEFATDRRRELEYLDPWGEPYRYRLTEDGAELRSTGGEEPIVVRTGSDR